MDAKEFEYYGDLLLSFYSQHNTIHLIAIFDNRDNKSFSMDKYPLTLCIYLLLSNNRRHALACHTENYYHTDGYLKWMVQCHKDVYQNSILRLEYAYLLFNKFIMNRIIS